jgi:hypothetical protein
MAIYLPIVTQFNPKGLKQAEKGFKDLEGAQAKAKYALGKANKYAAVALGGLVAGLGDAVKGAMEDEQAQKLLARQLQKTTGATDKQIAANEDWISTQGKLLGVTDDELRPALAGLVRATGSITTAQKAATLAMDVAAAKGLSLETVTKSLERAYGGNMTALAKLSPELKQMIKDGASMDEVMAAMSKTFGGAATDSANTAAGSMKRLGIALGEAKEGVGAALLPVLEKALPVLQKFATWAQNNPNLVLAVAAAIGVLTASVVALNVAMAINPAVLITAGIVALIAAIAIAYKKFETFASVVNFLVNNIARNFEFMANAFITMVNVVIKGINLLKPGKDIESLGAVSVGRLGGNSVGAGGGNTGSARGFTAMATGGIVTSPTMALIGEAGPEAVIPLNKAGGLGMNITVNTGVGDPVAIGKSVVDALQAYQNRSGPLPIKVK